MEKLTTAKIILLVIVGLNLITSIINAIMAPKKEKMGWVNASCGWTIAAIEILND